MESLPKEILQDFFNVKYVSLPHLLPAVFPLISLFKTNVNKL